MKTNNFIRYWLPAILFAAFIFTCSSMSRPPRIIPPLFPHSDKISHFTEYAIFGFLLLRALDSSKDRFKGYNLRTIAVVLAVLYGISDELHQYFVPGRFTELGDLISDGLGAYVGQLFFKSKG